jgi:hypothetical protein
VWKTGSWGHFPGAIRSDIMHLHLSMKHDDIRLIVP